VQVQPTRLWRPLTAVARFAAEAAEERVAVTPQPRPSLLVETVASPVATPHPVAVQSEQMALPQLLVQRVPTQPPTKVALVAVVAVRPSRPRRVAATAVPVVTVVVAAEVAVSA